MTQVFIKTTHELRVLSFIGADGSTTTLNTTDEHPFFVVNRGWTRADQLQIGDTLLQPDGSTATVTASTVEERAEGVTVYNLEVDGGHTYFVDDQTNGAAVWVHNASCGSVIRNLNSNKAISRFGIYEIRIKGVLRKIGKADLNRVTASSDLPTRIHQQVRKLGERYGKSKVTGKVVEDLAAR